MKIPEVVLRTQTNYTLYFLIQRQIDSIFIYSDAFVHNIRISGAASVLLLVYAYYVDFLHEGASGFQCKWTHCICYYILHNGQSLR